MKTLLSLTKSEYQTLKAEFERQVKNKESQYTVFGSWYRNRKN